MVGFDALTPSAAYSAFSSSKLLNVPSSLHALPQGTLRAVGMWPPRWHVSGKPGGANISPVNSCGPRTSTSDAAWFFTASCTCGRKALNERSASCALYWVGGYEAALSLTSRLSASHFLRPPFRNLTSLCP